MCLFYFREGYKLYIPLHKSAVTGRFQVSGLLFLATENRMNVSKGLTFFKKSLPFTQEDLDTRFHFLVDKDFDYIEVLHLVFPGCRVLLDSVHVERYFRDKVFPGNLFFLFFFLKCFGRFSVYGRICCSKVPDSKDDFVLQRLAHSSSVQWAQADIDAAYTGFVHTTRKSET